jgi:hypothetical protein
MHVREWRSRSKTAVRQFTSQSEASSSMDCPSNLVSARLASHLASHLAPTTDHRSVFGQQQNPQLSIQQKKI